MTYTQIIDVLFQIIPAIGVAYFATAATLTAWYYAINGEFEDFLGLFDGFAKSFTNRHPGDVLICTATVVAILLLSSLAWPVTILLLLIATPTMLYRLKAKKDKEKSNVVDILRGSEVERVEYIRINIPFLLLLILYTSITVYLFVYLGYVKTTIISNGEKVSLVTSLSEKADIPKEISSEEIEELRKEDADLESKVRSEGFCIWNVRHVDDTFELFCGDFTDALTYSDIDSANKQLAAMLKKEIREDKLKLHTADTSPVYSDLDSK